MQNAKNDRRKVILPVYAEGINMSTSSLSSNVSHHTI
uniref:Uncharacterized protein n=1 Tax=Brassica campestris TaxID=3711 RepID=A0A3P5YG19_BRACM|nr:unnamed protein product [Brassica rapa]